MCGGLRGGGRGFVRLSVSLSLPLSVFCVSLSPSLSVCVCVVLTLSCHDGPKSDVDERCVWSDVTFSLSLSLSLSLPLSIYICVCVCEGRGQDCYNLPFLGIEKRRCVQHSLYPLQVPSPPRPPLLLSRRPVPLPHQVITCMGAWVQCT